MAFSLATSCDNVYIFFSCINHVGMVFILSYSAAVLTVIFCTLRYYLRRRSAIDTHNISRCRLTFHSPDEVEREFGQKGLIRSTDGVILLYSWVVLFAFGYISFVVISLFSYAPKGFLWFKPMNPWITNLFSEPEGYGWSGVIAPWAIIFTIVHFLWFFLGTSWEFLQITFMMPASTLDAPATHVMIEEVLEFDTDKDITDPDATATKVFKDCINFLIGSFSRPRQISVLPITVEADGTRQIEYTCVRYVYDRRHGRFRPKGIKEYTAAEVHEAWQKGGLTDDEAAKVLNECGKNEIHVHVPSHSEALINEYRDFTYTFNSLGTWTYFTYGTFNIGTFWICMTIFSGTFRALGIVRPNQKKVAELAQLETPCTVLRGGRWLKVTSSNIVLGDILSVDGKNAKLPCDCIVVEGTLVVDESMLTGEPMPIQKMAVENSHNASVGKKNIAHAGTSCMQSSGPHDGKAVLIAIGVGACTTRGQLVRMVLFPTSVRFKYNDQMPIVYGILFVYMVIQIVIYFVFTDLGGWLMVYLMSLCTVAQTLNPLLPVSLVMGQTVTASRLQRVHQIQCLQPARIPIAGKISLMVFDKTGTITKDGMDFDSVIPVADDSLLGEPVRFVAEDNIRNQQKMKNVPELLRHAMASCHTVTALNDGTLVGNAVEVSMVNTSGWSLEGLKVISPTGDEALQIVKKLDFDHKRMTSGVVVRSASGLRVYVKGSYEKIQAISRPESVPANYVSTTEQCAKEGYYVLGISTKSLEDMSSQQVADLSRDSVEDGLGVCGLMLFRNEMKKDSPQALEALKKGDIRSVICTGDNALTGISIGRQCGIATTSVVLLGELGDGGFIEWRDPDQETFGKVDIFSEMYTECQLAVTQGAWRFLYSNLDELHRISKRLVVFARMKPEDKINVVKFFQSLGLVVGMAGDGGNDCGGLRAAHAGLALSDAEASMVSPFSSGRDGKSLMTVVDMIREGRACLTTNLASFQYYLVYGITASFLSVMINLRASLSFGEYVWFWNEILVGIPMTSAMVRSQAADELSEYRPTATLLGWRTISAVLVPFASASLNTFIAWQILEWQDFYGGLFRPLHDLGLPPQDYLSRGDNYDTEIAAIFLMLTHINTAYVNTYGGAFRAGIMKNIWINALYGVYMSVLIFLMMFAGTRFHCIFRINCDTDSSLAAGTGWPWSSVAFWSAGGLGSCFMGPQARIWQAEMTKYYTGTADEHAEWKGPDYFNNDYWLPNKNATLGGCYPPYNLLDDGGAQLTPKEFIDTPSCKGPNNCLGLGFRVLMFILFSAYVVLNHAYVKLILQGETFRTRSRQNEQKMSTVNGEGDHLAVELEDRGASALLTPARKT